MTIFLILAPYGAFATLMLVSSAAASLFAGAVICLLVIGHDAWRGRSIKMLGTGSAILFVALGCYLVLAHPGLSSSTVKLTVDAGMLAISLMSLAIRRPFTLQYAREMVDAEMAQTPGFIRANYIITSAWSGAFLLMVFANVLMLYLPGLPLWSGLLVAFAARNSAVYFSRWYPRYRRTKHGQIPAPGLPATR
jgi:hypothetical protein